MILDFLKSEKNCYKFCDFVLGGGGLVDQCGQRVLVKWVCLERTHGPQISHFFSDLGQKLSEKVFFYYVCFY